MPYKPKTCRRCGEWYVPMGSNQKWCKGCAATANLEAKREHNRRYYAANTDIIKEHSRRYKAANTDIIKERKRHYYAANKEEIKERERRRYAANKENERNRELARLRTRHRRAVDPEWRAKRNAATCTRGRANRAHAAFVAGLAMFGAMAPDTGTKEA